MSISLQEIESRRQKLRAAAKGKSISEYASDPRLQDCTLFVRMQIATKAKLQEKIDGVGNVDLLKARKAVVGNEKVVGITNGRKAGNKEQEAA